MASSRERIERTSHSWDDRCSGVTAVGVPAYPRSREVRRSIGKRYAVPGMPAAERCGSLRVVGEQEVLDRVGDSLTASLEVWLDPRVDTSLMGSRARRPGREVEHKHRTTVDDNGQHHATHPCRAAAPGAHRLQQHPDQPTSSAQPITEAPTPTCGADDPESLTAPTRVAAAYLEALRMHDEDAVYDIAASGLKSAQSRKEFTAGLSIDKVESARATGITAVGRSEGKLLAITPVEVTVGGVSQAGRVVLVKESGKWRFLAAVSPPEAPTSRVISAGHSGMGPAGRLASCELRDSSSARTPSSGSSQAGWTNTTSPTRTPRSWRSRATRCMRAQADRAGPSSSTSACSLLCCRAARSSASVATTPLMPPSWATTYPPSHCVPQAEHVGRRPGRPDRVPGPDAANVHFEGELAVVIGRICRDVPGEQVGRRLRLHRWQRRDRPRPAEARTANGRELRASTRSAHWGRGSRPTSTRAMSR